MSEAIKPYVNELSERGDITSKKDSDKFEIFCNFCILDGILKKETDPLDGWLDGDEYGLDSVAIFVNDEMITNTDSEIFSDEKKQALKNSTVEFVFIQSKTSSKIDVGDLLKCFSAAKNFFNNTPDKGETDQLIDLMNVRKALLETAFSKKPSLKIYYACQKSYEGSGDSKEIKEETEKFIEEVENLHFTSIPTVCFPGVG